MTNTSNNIAQIMNYFQAHPTVFLLLVVWLIVWKGLALWHAARLGHKVWYVILLVANTVGLLEIFYIFFIARKYSVEEQVVDGEK